MYVKNGKQVNFIRTYVKSARRVLKKIVNDKEYLSTY